MRITVGENIIATTKIRNNYGAILSFIFPFSIYGNNNIFADYSLLYIYLYSAFPNKKNLDIFRS